MDNPANPVFFNTFDPFDNPTPPPNPITKSSSLTNSSSLQAPAHHDVNTTNVLQPSTANVNSNNNYPYLPSPLDSPSINPYPLPRSSFAPSPSPSPASSSPVPPAYSSNSSSLSNSYSVPSTNSSSVPKTSPLGSPSLTSQSNGYPQFQAPSPVPPSYGTTSPIPNQSQPVQFHQAPSPAPPPYGSASPIPNQSQPRAPSPVAQSYGTTSPIPSSQSMYDSNPGMKYFQSPSSQVTQTSPPQPTPPTQSQSTQPSFSLTTTSQSPTLGPQKDILEQMNKSLNAVMTRLDSIENRLSFLEITTKEVLNNQRTISTQQRKLQDSVDTTKMPAPVPQHIHQHVYEEPRKAQVPAYPQPPLQPPPTHSHISPPVIMPPPTSHSHMPALVPVTHIADRGAMDYKPSMASRGGPSQYDADLELAKKLQAEFDSSSSSSSSSTPSSSSSSNANSSSMSSSYSSKPISQPSSSSSQSKSGHQECPICQTRVALADLEAHVEQHFEDDEAKRAPPKPGEKQMSKSEAKAGFFAKLFGPKPEDEKKPSTEQATPAPAATPSPAAAAQVPYTHTMNPAYNQRMGYYAAPGMPAASPGRAMYAAPYYGYPVQNVPRSAAAQPQQFLYYPNLDQNPQ